MRRYYQATLAAIAIISVISLLFYRHEYNKLRYVLEVFDYFGKPSGKPAAAHSNCVNVNETIINTEQQHLNEPLTSWQRLRDDLYVYSAYSISYNNDVHLIALGETNKEFHLACSLFFDDETEPLRATFRYMAIRNAIHKEANSHMKSPYVGYRFTCSHTSSSGEQPVGVKLVADVKDTPLENVVFPVRVRPKTLRENATVICVSPPLHRPIFSTDIFAFLGFHHLIGVKYFLLYDFGISSLITARLGDLVLSPTDLKSKYTTLPWNFPFADVPSNVVRDIVQEDCLYRTYGKAFFAVTLSWEEFMVPKYHGTIYDLVVDLSKTRLQADRYKLQIRTFCTNMQRDEQSFHNSTITVFKNTHFEPSIVESRAIYMEKPGRVLLQSTKHIVTRDIQRDLLCVNRYITCNETKAHRGTDTYDPSISRFAKLMHNLKVFRKSLE